MDRQHSSTWHIKSKNDNDLDANKPAVQQSVEAWFAQRIASRLLSDAADPDDDDAVWRELARNMRS
jgi:hypothetical protein